MTRIKSCNVNFGSSVVIGEFEQQAKKRQEEQERQEEEAKRQKQLTDDVLADAKKQADAILAAANADAQKIIEAANLERETVDTAKEEAVKQGFEEGHKAGYLEGEEKIRQEMQDKVAAVDTFAHAQFEIKNKIMASATGDMLNFCFEVCKKVCGESLNGEILERIINKALKALEAKTTVTVMISPKLMAKLEPEFSQKFKNVKIIQNEKIADDNVIVESLAGNIDCSVSVQIEKIAGEFLNGG